ncbi:UNVERIFIED_ORG: hypothetical protein ABIB52_004482, partial [Arthrobacter sp. UYCu721]
FGFDLGKAGADERLLRVPFAERSTERIGFWLALVSQEWRDPG